jgi:hypothetical protein
MSEPVVTTTMFTEAERAAWEVAVLRGLAIEAADLRALLNAAMPFLAAAEVSAHRAEQDAVHAGLSQMLRVLGMGDHARPQSSHEVMLDAINEVGRIRVALERAEAIIKERDRQLAHEQERGEALVAQAQDYARAESERADRLVTLAREILTTVTPGAPDDAPGFARWRVALEQLEDAAGEMSPPDSEPEPEPGTAKCICVRFRDTGGFRIADLTCPVHGVNGTDPGDGYWEGDRD